MGYQGPFESLVAAVPMLQERTAPWGWDMHPMWWMWGAGGFVMMLVVLAFWGVLIAGIVVAIRWIVAQGREPRADTALQILRERYARGEISREEFEARRRDLT